MAQITVKRSSVPGKAPLVSDLALGEIAINTNDGIAYIKKDVSGTQTIIPLGGGSGTVTSVSGTGTVSGLTLSGTVTSSGSLTLGGTLSLTSSQVTTALGYTPYNATNPNGYTSNTGDVTLTGTQTLTNKTVKNSTLEAYQEKVQVVGIVSTTTYNIDLSLANIFDITLGANVTFTFTNPPASNFSKPTTIILRQGSAGNRLATFTNAKYTDGILPILSTGINQIDVLTFFTLDGGSFWFGTFAMANVS